MFVLQNFARTTASNGTDHLVNRTNGLGTREGAPVMFTYRSDADLKAVIVAADYFLPVLEDLQKGDLLYIIDSAGVASLAFVATILYHNENEAANVPTVTLTVLV